MKLTTSWVSDFPDSHATENVTFLFFIAGSRGSAARASVFPPRSYRITQAGAKIDLRHLFDDGLRHCPDSHCHKADH